jgi:membrane-bound serine protease (ClpP class)
VSGALRALACAALLAPGVALAQPAEEEKKGAAPERSGPVLVARLDGSVNPASADFLKSALVQAEEANAAALIVELDTPGGLVSSTQDIIQAFFAARVPVVVYVSPQGAWAGSAGVFITLAAHVAAMAPGATIGAAHPVEIGLPSPPRPPSPDDEEEPPLSVEEQKAENLIASYVESIAQKRGRNVEWAGRAVRESIAATAEEALELKVIDLVVRDRSELLQALDGREVALDAGPVRLDLAQSEVRELEMPLTTRLMNVIVDPRVVTLLLMGGLIALYIEISQPGVGLPGAVGVVCLLLVGIALQVLPFSWTGVLFVLAGVALIVSELFVTSHGLLLAGGAVCLLVGGSMMFDRPELSDLTVPFWTVLLPAVGGFVLFGALIAFSVGRAARTAQQSGTAELLGMRGVASTALAPSGTVFLRGEYWRAESEAPVAQGDRIEVLAVDGLTLRVRPLAKPGDGREGV